MHALLLSWTQAHECPSFLLSSLLRLGAALAGTGCPPPRADLAVEAALSLLVWNASAQEARSAGVEAAAVGLLHAMQAHGCYRSPIQAPRGTVVLLLFRPQFHPGGSCCLLATLLTLRSRSQDSRPLSRLCVFLLRLVTSFVDFELLNFQEVPIRANMGATRRSGRHLQDPLPCARPSGPSPCPPSRLSHVAHPLLSLPSWARSSLVLFAQTPAVCVTASHRTCPPS